MTTETAIQIAPAVVSEAATLQVKTTDLSKRATDLVVSTKEQAEEAVQLGVTIKTAFKNADAIRDGFVRPFNTGVKNINDTFRPFLDQLRNDEQVVKAKIIRYNDDQERLQREENARQRQAAEASALATAQAAQDRGDTVVAEAALDIAAKAQSAPPAAVYADTVRTDSGASAAARKDWVYEVVDPALVPREWLLIDEKKVNAAIKGGKLTEIPGLRIFQKSNVSFRR